MEKSAIMALSHIITSAKLRLLQMHYEGKIGHIGGNLSVIDALVYLYNQVIGDTDSLVLSKGHSAGALYVALWATGRLAEEKLLEFHREGVKMAGHPVAGWHPSIIFSTGSLGHGVGLAAGRAYGNALTGTPGRVFCVTSDGEWEEGSNWEALIFSAHHRLANLTVLVDANGLQGFGSTTAVASLEPLGEKFRSFGVSVQEIDGHNSAELESAINATSEMPKFILLRTIKGHGVSFMENRMEWHYLPLNSDQYQQAVDEIEERA
jgi:transketolase